MHSREAGKACSVFPCYENGWISGSCVLEQSSHEFFVCLSFFNVFRVWTEIEFCIPGRATTGGFPESF